MKTASLCMLLILVVSALQAGVGTVPRRQASSYPNHAAFEGGAVGAALLSAESAKRLFVTEVYREYVVVEVALYPDKGVTLDLAREHFVLRPVKGDDAVRAEHPKIVAARLQGTTPSKKEVVVVPRAGIGYETGAKEYNPRTGTYETREGVFTSSGVDVLLGSSQPASTPKDLATMELELSEKGLPTGSSSKAVAGYLYFPVEARIREDKRSQYQLEGQLQGKSVTLNLKP